MGPNFVRPAGVLIVRVKSGSNLYKTDHRHEIDPYVDVSLGADSGRSIALLRGGSDCAFNFTVSFPYRLDNDDQLVITVWDQDLGTKDDEVGTCSIPAKSFQECESKARVLTEKVNLLHTSRLSGRQKPGGSLDIEVYWEKSSVFHESTDDQLKSTFKSPAFDTGVRSVPIPLNYCVTNFNKLSGVAQTIMENRKLSKYTPYRTYRLRLWYVPFIFQGYTKGWNRDYKAAQQIYGNRLGSKTMRATLRIQNFMAYSNDYVNNHCQVHEISQMEGFHKMLQVYDSPSRISTSKTISSPRYTYVIMPDSHMHFSITSKKIATDLLSKHALHAGAATEVVYSGEFFFDRYSDRAKETGKTAFVIDNNSGTFGPPKEKLDLLKLLVQLNFGAEMPILALDREDPLLKELIEANGVE